PCLARLRVWRTESGSSPRERSAWRALRSLSASILPRSLRPVASTASYWKEGMMCSVRRSGVARDARDFLQRRDALLHPALGILVQAAHPALLRRAAQSVLAFVVVDHGAQGVVQYEELVHACAATVSGMPASGAAARVPGRGAVVLRHLALGAQLAHQALGQHAAQRGRQQK